MNYFYFFFFLSLSVLILIKPFTNIISNWVMRSKKLTKTGLVTFLIGIFCLCVSLSNEFWYERVWLIVTFAIGIALLIRGLMLIFFFEKIKKILYHFMRNYYKFSIPISLLLIYVSILIVSTDYIGPQKDISSCNSDKDVNVICGFLNPEDIVITPDKEFLLMSEFGAEFLPKNKYNFPLKLISTEMPVGINYKAGVSAQLKSAVILAALNSYGITEIVEIEKSRDHSENLLSSNVNAIQIKKGKKKIIEVFGKKHLNSINIDIPGDPSSAAFFTALTLLNKKSSLKIKKVGLNPSSIGFYNLLKKYGAKINFSNIKKNNNEVYGDIIIKSCKIKPIKASKEYYVKATDEYPILFVIAGLTQGLSIFKGIGDLANKESNRI